MLHAERQGPPARRGSVARTADPAKGDTPALTILAYSSLMHTKARGVTQSRSSDSARSIHL